MNATTTTVTPELVVVSNNGPLKRVADLAFVSKFDNQELVHEANMVATRRVDLTDETLLCVFLSGLFSFTPLSTVSTQAGLL